MHPFKHLGIEKTEGGFKRTVEEEEVVVVGGNGGDDGGDGGKNGIFSDGVIIGLCAVVGDVNNNILLSL